jgi:bifunctional NMN adenylyltransferase/nudix hydrolase
MKKLGVIVGRFQTPFLHEGHRHLIRTVLKENDYALIVLGKTTYGLKDLKNPFSPRHRMELIEWQFQNSKEKLIFNHIADIPDKDHLWSLELDRLILTEAYNRLIVKEPIDYDNITLYGGRDSFLNHYHGSIKTKEIDSITFHSASEIRELYLIIEK